MKQIILLLFFLAFCSHSSIAQVVPAGMKYQAVARNLDGQVLSNQNISLEVALVTHGKAINYQYIERHHAVTNKLGLFNLTIGEGQVMNGSFDQVPWSTEQVWMELSIDDQGGENFILIHSSKLLAVPYAYHAGTADNIASGENKAGGKAWELQGNQSTIPGTHFIGTTDSKDLVFKTSYEERMRISADGTVMMPIAQMNFAQIDAISAGGINVANDVQINGQLDVAGAGNFQNNLQVGGHLDILHSGHFGTTLEVNEDLNVGNELVVNGNTLLNKNLSVAFDAAVGQNLSVDKNANIGHDLSVINDAIIGHDLDVAKDANIGHNLNVINDANIGHDLDVANNVNIGQGLNIDGITSLNNTTESTASSNGALVVAGGVGVQKNLNVAGIAHVENTTESTGTANGALHVDGGLAVGKRLNVAGQTRVYNVQQSSVPTDGALTVDGGTGIAKNLNVGEITTTNRFRVIGNGDQGPNNEHVALFQNTNNSTGDGIAIKIDVSKPSSENNFVTFYDASNMVRGRIEGFDINSGDAFSDFPIASFSDFYDIASIENVFSIGSLPNLFPGGLPFLSGGSLPSVAWSGGSLPSLDIDWPPSPSVDFDSGSLPSLYFDHGSFPTLDPGNLPSLDAGSLPSFDFDDFFHPTPKSTASNKLQELICWGLSNGFEALITTNPFDWALAAQVINQTQICKDGGVTYASQGADYAEWLEKENPEEQFTFGQIVGVRGGKISKNTEGAEQVMAISLAPIVLGNIPKEGMEAHYEKVGFLGQVDVLVEGKVALGDYILPSGSHNGMGIAVSPEDIQLDQLSQVLGRAWSVSADQSINMINVIIGLKTHEWVSIIQKQQDEVNALTSQLEKVDSRLEALESHLSNGTAQVVKSNK